MHKSKKHKKSGGAKDKRHKQPAVVVEEEVKKSDVFSVADDASSPAASIAVTHDDDDDGSNQKIDSTLIGEKKLNDGGEVFKASDACVIKYSDVMGRYLVAARDLKPGEVLIEDQPPLVTGPCQGTRPLCLGCCEPLAVPLCLSAHCPRCGWPMCSEECAQTSKLHQPECDLLVAGGNAPLSGNLLDEKPGLYNAIVPLRCLYMRDAEPEKWRTLMTMESHNEVRKARPIIWNTNQQLVVDPIRVTWGLADKFTEQEVHTVCGILEVNGFEVGTQGKSGRGLYPEAFYIAHACVPNTTHTDDHANHLTIRTACPVKAGQTLSLTYAYTLQGTLKRRQHLRESKFFECCCDRCSDPTELGTFCSALLCPRCTAPRVLSSDPLNDDAPWKCASCGDYSVPASSVDKLLTRLGAESEAIDANDVKAFESFITQYRKVLPSTHYLVIGAKHSLSQLYGKTAGYLINQLTEEQLCKKRDMCRELLPVFDVLEPGLSRLRGVTLYELHAPLMILTMRSFESRSMSKSELLERMKEVARCLEQSEAILRFEPDHSSEGEMAKAATQALVQVNKWRKLLAVK